MLDLSTAGSALRLSLQIALLATLNVTLIGGLTGYLLVRFRFPGRDLLEALLTLPLVLPPTVVGFYLLILLGRYGPLSHLYALNGSTVIFTWQAAVIAATVMALPLMVKTTKAALESVDPIYLQAASTLGQSHLETLFRVWLPLAWKGILAGIMLSFARALGEFGATLMIAGNIPGVTQTMPMAIYDAVQAGNNSLSLVLVIILSAIATLVLVITNYLGRQNFI